MIDKLDKLRRNSQASLKTYNSLLLMCFQENPIQQVYDIDSKKCPAPTQLVQQLKILKQTLNQIYKLLGQAYASLINNKKGIKKNQQLQSLQEPKRGYYNSYTQDFKRIIIHAIQTKGYSTATVASKFGIPSKNVFRWCNKGIQKQKGGRRSLDREMQDQLNKFIREAQQKKIPLCFQDIQEFAFAFSKFDYFKASKGWFDKFRSRFHLPKNIITSKRNKNKEQLDSEQCQNNLNERLDQQIIKKSKQALLQHYKQERKKKLQNTKIIDVLNKKSQFFLKKYQESIQGSTRNDEISQENFKRDFLDFEKIIKHQQQNKFNDWKQQLMYELCRNRDQEEYENINGLIDQEIIQTFYKNEKIKKQQKDQQQQQQSNEQQSNNDSFNKRVKVNKQKLKVQEQSIENLELLGLVKQQQKKQLQLSKVQKKIELKTYNEGKKKQTQLYDLIETLNERNNNEESKLDYKLDQYDEYGLKRYRQKKAQQKYLSLNRLTKTNIKRKKYYAEDYYLQQFNKYNQKIKQQYQEYRQKNVIKQLKEQEEQSATINNQFFQTI